MKEDNYEDIINLPHYTSKKHKRMSLEARCAQFAPFAALTGHSDAVKETERLTEKRIEIDEETKMLLNNRLQIILRNINKQPEITFTYFIHDKNKSGGKYNSIKGIVKKIDLLKKEIILLDKTKIPINELINITGDIFNNIEN